MDSKMPENLMDDVERKLRKHVKDKRKNIYRAAAILLGLAVILPTSAYAYTRYMDNILYKQEIDLARENNDAQNINKTFKYKDVTFTIKDIVADTTGMEVIYEVSDPKYSVSDISLGDKDREKIQMASCEYMDYENSKEKSFYIEFNGDKVNNPITININKIEYHNGYYSSSILDKFNSFIYGSNKAIKLDWTLKTKIAMKEIKTISINKKIALEIGTLKINSLNLGIIKSKLSYSFVAKESNIATISPIFSIRLGDKYTTCIYGGDYGSGGGIPISGQSDEDDKDGAGYYGSGKFDSVYYQNINQIGIKLVGIDVNYDFSDSKIYKINKYKIPNDYVFNGQKFAITSIKNENDVPKYTVEYGKSNRVYNNIQIKFCQEDSESSGYETKNKVGKLEYINQAYRDKVYAALAKKVPNLRKVEGREENGFEDGVISSEITMQNKESEVPLEFKVTSASKTLIYDEEEIVIDNLSK